MQKGRTGGVVLRCCIIEAVLKHAAVQQFLLKFTLLVEVVDLLNKGRVQTFEEHL